jgi:hypothetical protein
MCWLEFNALSMIIELCFKFWNVLWIWKCIFKFCFSISFSGPPYVTERISYSERNFIFKDSPRARSETNWYNFFKWHPFSKLHDQLCATYTVVAKQNLFTTLSFVICYRCYALYVYIKRLIGGLSMYFSDN